LNYHFETQPLPNPLAWYAHQLPDQIKRLGVLDTHIVEILIPLLFFAPIRSLRIFAGIRIHVLMIMIMLTGNYNFFNLLTIVINMVNFDDDFLTFIFPKWIFRLLRIPIKEAEEVEESTLMSILTSILPLFTVISLSIYLLFFLLPTGAPLNSVLSISDLKEFLQTSNFPFMYIVYLIIVFFLVKMIWSYDINEPFKILALRGFYSSALCSLMF
jgi:hypothetical protein